MPQSKRPTGYVLRIFERFTEQSYATLFSTWTFIFLAFAAGYFLLGTYAPRHGISDFDAMDTLTRVGNSLYFSIVTVTTVGYGDFVPHGFSKTLAGVEAVFGFFVFAVFMTKLVSRKNEMLTTEMHTAMFETKFHLTREGFFTIRKDFDAVIRDSEENGKLLEDDWDKLAIAYWEGQRLFEGIPAFYGGHGIIGKKRERLLVEAVHRTMERLLRMLQILSKNKINWGGHKEHYAELKQFTVTAVEMVLQWRKASTHRNDAWFDRLGKSVAALRKRTS